MAQPDDSFDLAMAAASLRADSPDVHALLRALSVGLDDALGDRLRVQRGGGRFRRSDAVTSVQATLANDQFDATIEGSALRCTIGRLSGGVRIRSEDVDMDTWILRLLTALQAEAAHNESARQALEHIVLGGHA
jgi:hypothetical protein